MGNNFVKPRGTMDLIGDSALRYDSLVKMLDECARLYGASMIMVPTYEESRLYKRGVGESTDIVTKETFDIVSKGGHEYTLRPEFTAGITRAVIENKEYALPHMPLKYYYHGSIFRYERPQAGRFREPHQWGVEFFDQKLDLGTIIEVLSLLVFSLKKIGIKNPVLKINSLGSNESRIKYKEALVNYFSQYIDSMCEDCQSRLKMNPLRILDCKVSVCRERVKDAPIISDYLIEEDQKEFEEVKKMLDELQIEYVVDDRLVRGLDYYTGIVFEVYEKDHQNIGAIGGGGIYTGLCKSLGGPDLQGIGFSFGLDRLLLSLDQSDIVEENDVMLYVSDDLLDMLKLANQLRQNGISVIIPHIGKSLKSAMKMADSKRVKRFIFKKDSQYIIKDMIKNEQIECKFDSIIDLLGI